MYQQCQAQQLCMVLCDGCLQHAVRRESHRVQHSCMITRSKAFAACGIQSGRQTWSLVGAAAPDDPATSMGSWDLRLCSIAPAVASGTATLALTDASRLLVLGLAPWPALKGPKVPPKRVMPFMGPNNGQAHMTLAGQAELVASQMRQVPSKEEDSSALGMVLLKSTYVTGP